MIFIQLFQSKPNNIINLIQQYSTLLIFRENHVKLLALIHFSSLCFTIWITYFSVILRNRPPRFDSAQNEYKKVQFNQAKCFEKESERKREKLRGRNRVLEIEKKAYHKGCYKKVWIKHRKIKREIMKGQLHSLLVLAHHVPIELSSIKNFFRFCSKCQTGNNGSACFHIFTVKRGKIYIFLLKIRPQIRIV